MKKLRSYVSSQRDQAAEATRRRVLTSAKRLFARRGIDDVTIDEIAAKAGVSVSTVYTLYKSKEGLLHALMSATLLGPRFQEARTRLDGVADPVEAIRLTADVARAIYDSEFDELGLIRGASAFSLGLRKLEQRFEALRLEMQQSRIEALFAAGRLRRGLSVERARRILWMLTGRDIYRMLVVEAGWSSEDYGEWLRDALTDALVESAPARHERSVDYS